MSADICVVLSVILPQPTLAQHRQPRSSTATSPAMAQPLKAEAGAVWHVTQATPHQLQPSHARQALFHPLCATVSYAEGRGLSSSIYAH